MQYVKSQGLTEENLMRALFTEVWAGLRKLENDSEVVSGISVPSSRRREQRSEACWVLLLLLKSYEATVAAAEERSPWNTCREQSERTAGSWERGQESNSLVPLFSCILITCWCLPLVQLNLKPGQWGNCRFCRGWPPVQREQTMAGIDKWAVGGQTD